MRQAKGDGADAHFYLNAIVEEKLSRIKRINPDAASPCNFPSVSCSECSAILRFVRGKPRIKARKVIRCAIKCASKWLKARPREISLGISFYIYTGGSPVAFEPFFLLSFSGARLRRDWREFIHNIRVFVSTAMHRCPRVFPRLRHFLADMTRDLSSRVAASP